MSGKTVEGVIRGLEWCWEHAFQMGPDLYPCPECRVEEIRREARNEALEEAAALVQARCSDWPEGQWCIAGVGEEVERAIRALVDEGR